MMVYTVSDSSIGVYHPFLPAGAVLSEESYNRIPWLDWMVTNPVVIRLFVEHIVPQ